MASTSTAGTGSDTLVLKLSQDAYQGDAEYRVLVDGKQVGDTFTAQALRGSGETDTLTLEGDWGTGEHSVAVEFLNDAWDGTPETDRNLFLEGASYNGEAVDGAALELFSAGAAGFAFTDDGTAAPPPVEETPPVEEPPPVGATPRRAAEFLDAIGVNAHPNYLDTGYGDWDALAVGLKYIGARHLREMLISEQDLNRLREFHAETGVKFNINIVREATLDQQLALIEQAAREGLVSSVEGPNEIRWFPVQHEGLTGNAAAIEMQKDLYAAVKASPVLRDIPVIQLSTGDGATYGQLGDLSPYADYANPHIYFGDGNPPTGMTWAGMPSIEYGLQEAQAITQGKPAMPTETGYSSAPHHVQGVSEEVQGPYVQRLLLELWDTDQVERAFLYELLDLKPDPIGAEYEHNLGMFRADWTPKPAAELLHNLTGVLQDDGAEAATFETTPLDYTLSGMPATAQDALLQRSDGAHLLAIWNDADGWDENADKAIEVPDAPVTLELGEEAAVVRVHDTADGSIETFTDTSSIELAMPDHALVIEII
jgi:trimeric autotransporter adhesin